MRRPNFRQAYSPLIALVLALTFGVPGWADSPVYDKNPNRLVLFRPSGSLRGDIENARRGSRQVIAVVMAKEEPKCAPSTRSDGTVTEIIYCWVRIQFVELIDGNPENRVRLHYWYLEESDIVNIAPGTKILVVLALAVMHDTYVSTIMMRATEENIAAVRAALREIDG